MTYQEARRLALLQAVAALMAADRANPEISSVAFSEDDYIEWAEDLLSKIAKRETSE